jgi:hypothetical protein
MTSDAAVPNFLYIGTSKAGSTWIFNLLDRHPRAFVTGRKGLHFFNNHYEQGLEWYLSHFQSADHEVAIGEISHTYLFSASVPERVFALNPHMKLMACLREPTDRAFSEYLDLVKNGKFEGTFDEALARMPEIIENGRYGTYLAKYFDRFPREQIHVAIFDDLKADPRRFAQQIFEFLGLEEMELPPAALRPRMPAGVPRSKSLAMLAKKGSRLALRLGLVRLRGKVKVSTRIRNVLYRPYGEDDRPELPPEIAARLRAEYASEVAAVDALLGTDLAGRWGYARP